MCKFTCKSNLFFKTILPLGDKYKDNIILFKTIITQYKGR